MEIKGERECVSVCVCVCERERGRREKRKERYERDLNCVLYIYNA